ncbi:MAG: RagB/SusD family nutrient uptake outer membrane protein [Rikenellaceae bacterium]
MRKNNISKIIAISTAVMAMVGCSKYLEYDTNRAYTDEYVWTTYTMVNRYMTAVYGKLPSTFMSVGSAFLDCTTDNAEHLGQNTDSNRFNTGTISAFDSPNAGWDDSFKGIRLANTLINNLDTLTLPTEQYDTETRAAHLRAIERYKGESRFLKAYFYFELFKRYGEVPIVDDWVSDTEPVDASRQSIADVISHIGVTLDEALEYLPTKAELNANSEYSSTLGHAIQGAAYALKSRTYLYAASPLFSEEGSAESREYYKLCAESSLLLFDGNYTLVSDYASLFEANGSTAFSNTEVILDRRTTTGYGIETNNQPVGFYGALGLTNPSQNLVDAYEMTDGSTFDWSKKEHSDAPFENRDSRLAATILYNGVDMLDRTVETFTGGRDATNSNNEGTRTGYYLKKYVDITADLSDPTGKRHYWPMFRLSEIYLNYAEAMNELYGPTSDPDGYGYTAVDMLDLVRKRVGQPALVDLDEPLTQDYVREKIRNERRVEFAFEDHRHWDLRRWKAGEGTLNGMLQGVEITRTFDPDYDDNYDYSVFDTQYDDDGNEIEVEIPDYDPYTYSYEVIEVEQRVFDTSYMYLYPIPYNELLWGESEIEQNPGW